jgi:hypothetical protein
MSCSVLADPDAGFKSRRRILTCSTCYPLL